MYSVIVTRTGEAAMTPTERRAKCTDYFERLITWVAEIADRHLIMVPDVEEPWSGP